MTRISLLFVAASLTLVTGCQSSVSEPRQWLAGDHHIHSIYSVRWDTSTTPPTLKLGGDAKYTPEINASKAKEFGLSWMVGTDHGGPAHARISLEMSYPALLEAREKVPDVIQFHGLELNTPGGDHNSIIIPHGPEEAQVLYDIESRFDRYEVPSEIPARESEALMVEALDHMKSLPVAPVVIVNHPSRSAKDYGEYGRITPQELRSWNDTAPNVAVGMAGAPGHQAIALTDRNPEHQVRGSYWAYRTIGGFDQMTARLGGFWDSMLGEGRRWWITANSDSHVHYSEGGVDFWPGEYSKTYVLAHRDHDDILEGIRAGRVFVTTGDLINHLSVELSSADSSANIGGTLTVEPGTEVKLEIRYREPEGPNASGDNPAVNRVDLIIGSVMGPAEDPASNLNPTTRVEKRFSQDTWQRDGDTIIISHNLIIDEPSYIRVRGTNTSELEPEPDPPGEDPWQDLWFYANPVFINTQ